MPDVAILSSSCKDISLGVNSVGKIISLINIFLLNCLKIVSWGYICNLTHVLFVAGLLNSNYFHILRQTQAPATTQKPVIGNVHHKEIQG